MRHTISVLVENTFGVLTRVAGMFSGRGYNIDSLNVAGAMHKDDCGEDCPFPQEYLHAAARL